MTTMPIGDARDAFSKLLADVERTHERVTITRHGHAIAVLISAEDLAALEETADVMSSQAVVEAISEGVAELDAGQEIDGPEVVTRFRRG